MWFIKGRYVYHYCAHYQISVGTFSYSSGIAKLQKRITSISDLNALRELIDKEHHEKLVVDSLSYLGREFD